MSRSQEHDVRELLCFYVVPPMSMSINLELGGGEGGVVPDFRDLFQDHWDVK